MRLPCSTRLLAAALLGFASLSATAACPGTVLDSHLPRLMGGEADLCEYVGQVVLVVNTASRCGFTGQYEGLEALHQRYQSRGFVVLGVPSDQFAGQEYAEDEKIAEFCKINYGVSFPMFTRSAVRGDDAIPLFRALIDATGKAPRWNFSKYLVGRDGQAIDTWGSRTQPESRAIVKAIEAALEAPVTAR